MEQHNLKLMIPGPIQPAADVLEAMGDPVVAHYGPAWTRYYNETLALLRQVYGTQGDVFIMPGSGTVAIDACLGSAFSSGQKILVGRNGFFGDRLQWVAESYGLECIPVMAEWGQPLKPEDFQTAYEAHPDAVGVALVHLETSTTVVNPVEKIAGFARQHQLCCFVDAVSSLGGLPMKMDEWGVDLCPTASQKCLGAPPGLGPVAVRDSAWDSISHNPHKGHGWYGDLRVWKQYAVEWGDWHPSPVTMATSNVRALRVALDDLLKEGISTRLQRYCSLAFRLREGLRRIGMNPYTPDDMAAPVLTAAWCPPGIPSGKIVSYLADEHGIKISGGLGSLKEQLIRIGHMSPTVTPDDIDEVLSALSDFSKAYHD
jgi:alanine-glyoxylate transaminase/serine-glyoxylate transaminase/serine-pyruvate transaminase